MAEPETNSEKVEQLKSERDAALIAVQQTKYFFEESIKQTERFWALFRWIAGVLTGVIVIAVGYQAYQNHVRLSDAVKLTADSVKNFLDSADERVKQLELNANSEVKAAIEKLYKAEISNVIVKNSVDESSTLIGYAEYVVQTGNDTPYGIDLTISFRFRIGYQGSGTTSLGGFNVSADEELLTSIFEDDVSVDRDAYAGGTFFRTADFPVLPNQLYPSTIQMERRILNCEDYDALMATLKDKQKLGTLTIGPVFRDFPQEPKFQFEVKVAQRTATPCKDLWNLGRDKRAQQ